MLCCSYNPDRSNIDFHQDRFISFSIEANDSAMSVFSDSYDLKNLMKEPTCYKNPNKLSCIDLMLTNKPRSFKHSCVIETGLSDFHRMAVTVMKGTFATLQPRVVNYTD